MITTMFRHYLSFLFKIARATKLGIELGSDVMLVALASFLAVFFSQYQSGFFQNLGVFLGVVVMVRVGVFFSAQLYSLSWRFASTRQFKRLYGAVLCGSVLMLGIFAVGDGSFLSNGLLFQFVGLEFLGTLCFIFSFRGLLRLLRDELLFLTKQASAQSLVPVLVIGAGAAGAMIANYRPKTPLSHTKYLGF
jgi:FlaA1/EpsC-like NDP-sugar epimerase